MDLLEASLPATNVPITAEGVCPVFVPECEKVASDGYCKCDSKDEECKAERDARREALRGEKVAFRDAKEDAKCDSSEEDCKYAKYIAKADELMAMA